MLSPTEFRDLVSGHRTGVSAAALRTLLAMAEWPYRAAVELRNRRYDRYPTAAQSAGVPVVSIGNLTLGGTGKTPLVEWVVRWLQHLNRQPAIVSRGYGSTAERPNDEARELALALPGVPHVQDPDRVAAAHRAARQDHADCLVLDDGFQHRRLKRDLDIVLLDATEPFGFEHVFPRGTLREPLAGLARAQVLVLSRANMVDTTERQAIRDRALAITPQAVWCEAKHWPMGLINSQGKRLPLEQLAGKSCAAFCGIGNPAGFRFTLDALDVHLCAWREFADHHDYTPADLQALVAWADGAELALCTRKDLVKLPLEKLGDVPLWAIEIGMEFLTGTSPLETALAQALGALV